MNTMIAPTRTAEMTSAHQQVALALNPRLIQPLLRSFIHKTLHKGAQDSDIKDSGIKSKRDACHILDAKYEPGKRCSILYEVREQMIIGELTWPIAKLKTASVSDLLPTMQLYPFERDPGLPTLTAVMDGNAMQRILNETLPECVTGLRRIVRCRVTLLRYRLGKRCTLRYDLRLRDTETGTLTTRTIYGKLYHSAEKAEAVYHEMQMLAAAQNSDAQQADTTNATRRNRLVVAKAVVYLPSLPMVLQAPVEDSAPLELLLQQPPNGQPKQLAQVTEGIRRAGAVLAELHQSTMHTNRTRAVDVELEKLERRSRRIADVDTATGTALHQLAQTLSARRAQLLTWDEEITVVHGDCKPSQFFLLPDGEMALLDFDHCGMADPAADVGNFLATLRQMGVKQILKQRDPAANSATATSPVGVAAWQQWLATLETAFLDEYVATRPCSVSFRRRATWYQAMALLRKALRSFARSTRSPLPSLLVQEAWQVLEAC